jgi:hypothetical protein
VPAGDAENNGRATLGGITGKGFMPGRSGNPGGRRPGLARAARELIGEDGTALIRFWLDVMNDETARLADRLQASVLLADRGWGRAPTFAPVEDLDPLEARQEEIDTAVEAFTTEVRRLAGRGGGPPDGDPGGPSNGRVGT